MVGRFTYSPPFHWPKRRFLWVEQQVLSEGFHLLPEKGVGEVHGMLPRERVFAAIARTGPDRPPLYVPWPTDGVLCEQGARLPELLRRYANDVNDFHSLGVPPCPPGALGEEFHTTAEDVWGVEWEYRIFGMHGHPKRRPLDELAALDAYRPPAPPVPVGAEFEAQRAATEEHKRRYYALGGWINIFEILHAVRRFEDVLMDLADDAPALHRLADLVVEYQEAVVHYLLAQGVNGVMFADDWGTACGAMVSLDCWRAFFRPRYARLMAPVLDAGKHVWYHTCGCTEWLWDDLADLGMHVFWPQLTCNDNARLAAWCRRRGITLLAHPDRSHLMREGTPEQVRAEVHRIAGTFGSSEGGLIFHGEVDRGFAFANVEALYEEVFSV